MYVWGHYFRGFRWLTGGERNERIKLLTALLQATTELLIAAALLVALLTSSPTALALPTLLFISHRTDTSNTKIHQTPGMGALQDEQKPTPLVTFTLLDSTSNQSRTTSISPQFGQIVAPPSKSRTLPV